MRAGDFTGLATITDPLSGAPFANNKIPSTRLDPRSVAIYNYVPLPNIPGTATAPAEQLRSERVGAEANILRYLARVDHHFSERDVVWGGFTFSDGHPLQAQGYGPTYGNSSSVGHFTTI